MIPKNSPDSLVTNPVTKGLNAFDIKCIAMLAMTADHVAWAFLDDDTYLAESLHFIGRLVAPLMAYFLVVGYHHSSDVKAYAGRLLFFALISQVPYWLFGHSIEQVLVGASFDGLWRGNVLFTLLVALIGLMIYHSRWDGFAKFFGIMALYPVAQMSDYGFALVVMALLFAHFYQDKKTLLIAYVLGCPVFYVLTYGFQATAGLGFMHFGVLLTVPLIYYFNGKKGSSFGGRYLFYWFYPAHLMIIAVLAWLWQM